VLRRIFGPKGRKWRETGEDCIMRSFITCTVHGDEMEEDGMIGRACGMNGRDENAHDILV
jgi:hypothetical protein